MKIRLLGLALTLSAVSWADGNQTPRLELCGNVTRLEQICLARVPGSGHRYVRSERQSDASADRYVPVQRIASGPETEVYEGFFVDHGEERKLRLEISYLAGPELKARARLLRDGGDWQSFPMTEP